MANSGDHDVHVPTTGEQQPPISGGRSVVEIPLTSYHNIVKFLKRAHEHRPNRDLLWCLRALDDYAPSSE